MLIYRQSDCLSGCFLKGERIVVYLANYSCCFFQHHISDSHQVRSQKYGPHGFPNRHLCSWSYFLYCNVLSYEQKWKSFGRIPEIKSIPLPFGYFHRGIGSWFYLCLQSRLAHQHSLHCPKCFPFAGTDCCRCTTVSGNPLGK